MKKNMKKLSAATLSLILIAIALVTMTSSCSKSTTNANFAGRYSGTLAYGSFTEGDTVTIVNGSGLNVTLTSKTNRGSTYDINGTVNGSVLNIPTQSVYISSLSENVTVVGSGGLNGSALTLNYTFTSPSSLVTHWSFTGTKE